MQSIFAKNVEQPADLVTRNLPSNCKADESSLVGFDLAYWERLSTTYAHAPCLLSYLLPPTLTLNHHHSCKLINFKS